MQDKFLETVGFLVMYEWLLLGYVTDIKKRKEGVSILDPENWYLRDDEMSAEKLASLKKAWKVHKKESIRINNENNKLVGNSSTNETYSSVMYGRTGRYYYRYQKQLLAKKYVNYTTKNPPSIEMLQRFNLVQYI